MNAVLKMKTFNQIKYLDELKETGLKENQAKAILNLVKDVNDFNASNLVIEEYLDVQLTKMKAYMDSRFVELEHKMDSRFTEFELKLVSLELTMSRRSNILLVSVIISILAPIAMSYFGLR